MSKLIPSEASNEIAIPEDIRAILAKKAQDSVANEQESFIPTLAVSGKKFQLGETVLGTEITVVIVASTFERMFSVHPYNKEIFHPPACFAIGKLEKEMMPDESSPMMQHSSCDECPHNQWNSSLTGKGKRCRTSRRLAVAAVTKDGKVDLTNVVMARISSSALPVYTKYIKGLARLGLPVWAVKTKLSFDPNNDNPVVHPAFDGVIPDTKLIEEIESIADDAYEMISQPFDVDEFELPKTPLDDAVVIPPSMVKPAKAAKPAAKKATRKTAKA